MSMFHAGIESADVGEQLDLNFITFSRTGDGITIGIVYHGFCRHYLVTYYELDGNNLMEMRHDSTTSPQIMVHRDDIFRIIARNVNDTICSGIVSKTTVYKVQRDGKCYSYVYVDTMYTSSIRKTSLK